MTTQFKATFVIVFTLTCLPMIWAQRFGPWSLPVNIGPPVNTAFADYQPFLSRDGLSLYFAVLEGGVGAPQDLWVAYRPDLDAPWEPPQRLPAPVNTSALEGMPFVTRDGHRLLFVSDRPGGSGGTDIYVSRRQKKRVDSGPGGWEEPVSLGSVVNSSGREQAPILFEDDATGVITLYFNSNRFGNDDIFMSTLQPDGTFGPATPVVELNTPSNEQHPTISRDGLEMYFASDRPGSTVGTNGARSIDIWRSTRESTSAPWSEPQPVTQVNSRYPDGRPALSFDGTTLYFQSGVRTEDCQLRGQCNVTPGSFDIWMSTREKLKGPEQN